MILYNTTFKVDLEMIESFKLFIENYFSDETLNKELYQLLNDDNTDGTTYCLQFIFEDLGTFNTYIVVNDVALKTEIGNRFGEKLLFFSSVLKKV